jgi:hypothetical protein
MSEGEQWEVLDTIASEKREIERTPERPQEIRSRAERGSFAAQITIGQMHEMGYGVEQSLEEATRWYRMAAEQAVAGGLPGDWANTQRERYDTLSSAQRAWLEVVPGWTWDQAHPRD